MNPSSHHTDDVQSAGTVDLFWIPLGAGAHVVRVSGRIYETVTALASGRSRRDLYHSALEVRVPEGRFVVEQAPEIDERGEERGVVVQGPVGMKVAGRLRPFRYEIRRWCNGQIPDLAAAVSDPVRVATDLPRARQVLDRVSSVPPLVWGRDQSKAGEMWNSNSVIAWVLSRSGIDVASISPPAGGRAPGWNAGLVVAARESGSC